MPRTKSSGGGGSIPWFVARSGMDLTTDPLQLAYPVARCKRQMSFFLARGVAADFWGRSGGTGRVARAGRAPGVAQPPGERRTGSADEPAASAPIAEPAGEIRG